MQRPRDVGGFNKDLLLTMNSSWVDRPDQESIMNTRGGIGVYHVGPRGVEEVPSRYNSDNNTIEFQANSFSTYVIAYKDVSKVPETRDETSYLVWFMLLAVGGCAITLASKLKKQY